MLNEIRIVASQPWRVHRTGDPQGPAMLLLHGFTGSGQGWEELASGLGDWHVIAPDLPGHGGTAAPTGAMPMVARDLVELLDQLGVAQAVVVGYSMGGRLALHLAAHAPDRVKGLVVVGATPGIVDPDERAARLADDESLARRIEEDLEAFVNDWENQPMFWSQRALTPETREAMRAVRLAHDPKLLAEALRRLGTGAQPPLHERLRTMSLPVLWVAGEYDLKFRAIAQSTRAMLPDVHVAVVPYAGHAVHVERPSAFRTLVREFVEPLRAPSRPSDQQVGKSPVLT